MLADALGRPVRFIITAGQVGDVTVAPALVDGLAGAAVLADKAHDSKAFRRHAALDDCLVGPAEPKRFDPLKLKDLPPPFRNGSRLQPEATS